MTLGENEAVSVLPLGILWVYVHLVKVAGGDELRDGQGTAGMTGLGLVDHVNDVLFEINAGVFQLCDIGFFHGLNPFQ